MPAARNACRRSNAVSVLDHAPIMRRDVRNGKTVRTALRSVSVRGGATAPRRWLRTFA